MPTLNRDQILKADDLPREKVNVPEWGGDVWIRTMTGTERDAFEQESIEGKGKNITVNMKNIRARLIVRTAVDESGKRLFAEADAVLLGAKSGKALDRVFDVAQEMSGLTDKDVEDLAKNSESGPSGDSTTD